MKHISFTALILVIFGGISIAQPGPIKTHGVSLSLPRGAAVLASASPWQYPNPVVDNQLMPGLPIQIGSTVYDLQSNASSAYGRLMAYPFPDYTIAAVWGMGMDAAGGFPDLGTGYNYFNGGWWMDIPTSRIESVRTGSPVYAPCGPSGEIVVAHQGPDLPLWVSKRASKGSGAWVESAIPLPQGVSGMLWPRMITTGNTHNTVHLLALTPPLAFGGSLYQNQDGALLYCRSVDGGETWEPWQHFDGLSATYYSGFNAETWSWMIPHEGNIGFLITDPAKDLFVMHSADYGNTWQKTLVWQHPYPFYSPTVATGRFYCPDGAGHGAFADNGTMHIAFGINRAFSDGSQSYWFPWVDGLAYWNSNMPAWTTPDTNALNPDLLYQSGNLIGWMQDLNGNDSLDLVGVENPPLYYLGPTSMPQIICRPYESGADLYVIYSSVTESYNNGVQDYRHIYFTSSYNQGQDWAEKFDLNGTIFHLSSECVFPFITQSPNGNIFDFLYQEDSEPGLHCRGDLDPPGINQIIHSYLEPTGINTPAARSSLRVGLPFPNPCAGVAGIDIETLSAGSITLRLMNTTGQQVRETHIAAATPGSYKAEINVAGLPAGMYVCTVMQNQTRITRKVLVK